MKVFVSGIVNLKSVFLCFCVFAGLFVPAAARAEVHSATVKGGDHAKVSYTDYSTQDYRITAFANFYWHFEGSFSISGYNGWSKSTDNSDTKSATCHRDLLVNMATLFPVAISGKIVPDGGSGGSGPPPPTDWSVTGKVFSTYYIDPLQATVAVGSSETFTSYISQDQEANSYWGAAPLGDSISLGGTASETWSIPIAYAAGVYSLKGQWENDSSAHDIVSFKLVGVKSVSCGEVTSETDSPGESETLCIPLGASGSTVTVTAESDPQGEWPTDYPTWTGASGEAGDTSATVATDTPGEYTATATCGISSKSIKICTVGLVYIWGPEIVALGDFVDYDVCTYPDFCFDVIDAELDPEGDGMIFFDTDSGVASVLFLEASDGLGDPTTVCAKTINDSDEVTLDVLVAEVRNAFCEKRYLTAGSSARLYAESNLPENGLYLWPNGYPLWEVYPPSGSDSLASWTGKDGYNETLSYNFSEPGNYLFAVECGNLEFIDVDVLDIDLDIAGIPEEKEDNPGGLLLVNDDDDNNNGIEDFLDSGSDDDLLPVSLKVLPEGISGVTGTVRLSVPSSITVWEDSGRNNLSALEWGIAELPSVLYLEGEKTASNANLTLTLELENGAECSDSVNITVFRPDIVVDQVSASDELAPGAFVALNNDDDNENGTADLEDTGGVANENDLLKLRLTTEPVSALNVMSSLDRGTLSLGTVSLLPNAQGGDIKFWKDANKTEALDIFTWNFSNTVPGFPTDWLYAEGIVVSKKSPDIGVNLVSSGFGSYKTSANVTVVDIDMDIDSDNNNGYSDPDCNATEDSIEDDSSLPGKILSRNILDTDCDGIPDFADGYDISFDGVSQAGTGKSAEFIPVVLKIHALADKNLATVKFIYSDSNPAKVNRKGKGTAKSPYVYTPAKGKLRLWTKNGAESRLKADITNGGDFIPSSQDIPVEDLNLQNNKVTLYLEAVDASSSSGDLAIEAIFKPEGEKGSMEFSDTVRATIVKIDLDVDSNNDGTVQVDDYKEDIVEAFKPGCIIPLLHSDDEQIPESTSNTDVRAPLKLAFEPSVSVGSVILNAGSGIKIWTAQTEGSEITLPKTYNVTSIPETLYIDGITVNENPDITMTYKDEAGNTIVNEKVKVLVVEPISYAPRKGNVAYVWSSLQSLGTSDGTEFANQASKAGFSVEWFSDSGPIDNNFNDCTLANYKKLVQSGAYHVISHGGSGAHYVVYSTEESTCDSWRGTETGMTTVPFTDSGNDYFAVKVSSSWLANNFQSTADTNRTIAHWAICYSASLLDSVGGRWRIGYTNPTNATEAGSVIKKLFEDMNGTTSNGQKRTAGKSWDAGGYASNAVMKGYKWTTLTAAPMLKTSSSVHTYPESSPEDSRLRPGGIIFDSYMNRLISPTDALTFSGNGSTDTPVWSGRSSSQSFCLGFYLIGTDKTATAISTKCRTEDAHATDVKKNGLIFQ